MYQQTRITTPKTTYTLNDYPRAIEFANLQNSVFWPFTEIDVEADVHDILVNMTEQERHGLLTVLKLFTKYELIVGNEYWGKKVQQWFPRPEIERMANCFSFFEINVHAPFYNEINRALHLDTDEFYNSYVEDETLKARIDFLNEALDSDDQLYSLGVFAMVEGAVLYSNFGFIKHFQSQGKNKAVHIVSGADFSVRDENIHHEAGCWLYDTRIKELRLSPELLAALQAKLYHAADVIREHEHRIVDMIFEKGTIEGITKIQLKNFVDSRLDLCLQNLGMTPKYLPASNPVGEWFYLGISVSKMHDFFAKQGNQYHRNWNEKRFVWRTTEQKNARS